MRKKPQAPKLIAEPEQLNFKKIEEVTIEKLSEVTAKFIEIDEKFESAAERQQFIQFLSVYQKS